MRRTNALVAPVALAAVLAASSSASAQDVFGPEIGSKNKYTTAIQATSGVDTDDFVGRMVAGELLSVTVTAAKGSTLQPGLTLIRPDRSTIQPDVKSKKGGKSVVLKKFPLDATGTWVVRVSGDGGTQGGYTVSFKIAKAKPIKLKKQVLPAPGKEEATHLFGAIEGALLDLKLTFDKKQGAVALDALKDPAGDDVPGVGGPLAGEAVVKKTKIQIKKAPVAAGDGDYAAMVSTADGSTAKYNLTLKVVPQGRLSAKKAVELSPDEPFLTVAGGTVRGAPGFAITVTGGNFSSDARAFVGAVEATVQSIAAGGGSLVLVVPPGADGTTADVAVVNGDGQGASQADFLFYAPPPEITSITSQAGTPLIGGSTAGDLRVRINGTGLVAQDVVSFGSGFDGDNLTALGTTQLLVDTPARAAANVNVVVTDEFGRSSSMLPFEFKNPPRINASPYTPPIAATNTATDVTVAGISFQIDDEVLFDGQVVASTFDSSVQHTATFPASALGDYTVQIRDRVGTLVSGPAFSVKEPPTLTALIVVSGAEAGPGEIPLLGGNTMRAIGTNFSGSDTVTLGGGTVTIQNRSPNQFEFVAPPHAAGAVTLEVVDLGGSSASLVDAVEYVGYVGSTTARSPGASATDDLSAMAGAVGDLDNDGTADDLVITSPNDFFENFYFSYGYAGTRYKQNTGNYNSPGTRAEYTRIFLGNPQGRLMDVTATRMPPAGSDPSAADEWNGTAVAIGDLDGVNGPDIVLGGIHNDYANYNDVRVFTNDGSGTFGLDLANTPASAFLPSYYAYYFYDYNGAGPTYFSTAYGYLVYSARYIMGIPTAIALGDLDQDSDLDVVVARDSYDQTYIGIDPQYVSSYYYAGYYYPVVDYYYIYAYSNNNAYSNLYINAFYYYSALTLLDNDIANSNGLTDVSFTNLPSVGGSGFLPVPGFHGRDVAIGDIDQANGNDIVVTWDDATTVTPYDLYRSIQGTGYGTPTVATRVLVNNGSGVFTDATATWMPAGAASEFFQAHQVELADFDGDGDLDMALLHGDGLAIPPATPTNTIHALRILRNDRPATSTFTNVTTTALPAVAAGSTEDFRGTTLAVRDINGDGNLDLVVGTPAQLSDNSSRIRSTRLFLGGGNLTFKAANAFLPAFTTDSGEAHTILLGDLAGSTDPVLIQLTEAAPTNSSGAGSLRTHDWEK